MSAQINCDMGESFGLYKMGDDEGIMPFISQANVACGFHGSDPSHMRRTVELAQRHGVKVGAHFSLPDLLGFGRREMNIDRDEMANIIIYQIGALKGFLDVAGIPLSHLKPHGALYGMAARMEHIAHAVADAAEAYRVPVLGLAGTLHEEIYGERGVGFQAEFFADLEYDDNGGLIITREHEAVDPAFAARRAVDAVRDGRITSINGRPLQVRAETVCIHSDTPNAVDIARAVRKALGELEAARGESPVTRERNPMAKHEVKSPIPGTFYRKPAPDQPPFKEVGDAVVKGDTIGLVEVMKTFHEVKTDADGTVSGFPIGDAEPVMAGQTIAELD